MSYYQKIYGEVAKPNNMSNIPDDYHVLKLCTDLMLTRKRLNADIVKLKNFIFKHKPSPHGRKKTIEANAQYEKELKEWEELMML